MSSRPRTSGFLAAAILLSVGVLLLAGCSRGARLETLWDAPQFVLTDESGRPFGSQQLAGRVWLVDFIYTNCPDECPLYLSPKMMALQGDVLSQNLAGKVDLVSISVDPRRDTPEVLAAYASRYGADPRVWHFLTGSDGAIQPLLQTGFKVGSAIPADAAQVTEGAGGDAPAAHPGVTAAPGGGSSIMHSTYFLLVDQHGKIRATYDGEEVQAEEMLGAVKTLLAQG